LFASIGDDILAGDAGNDFLIGGPGSDTYLFERNGDQDSILNKDTSPEAFDQLLFGEDISAEQLWFRQHDQNLEIRVLGSEDRVTVRKWYADEAYHLDAFKLDNGQILVESQVQQLVDAMAAFSPPSASELNLSGERHETLQPIIAASWQS